MTQNTHVIIFCGLDGSGKTTQAKKLINYLDCEKIPSEYVWLRYPNFLSLPFAGFLRLFGLTGYPLPEEKKSKGLKDLSSHNILQNFWIWFLYNDFKFVCKKKITKPLNKGKILVLDRFVIDTVVELAINSGNVDIVENLTQKFFQLIPENSKILFLDIEPKISYERNHEEDLETLEKKKIIYQKICKLFNISVIDGSKSIETIHHEILHQCGL